jgi:hypothetical protein
MNRLDESGAVGVVEVVLEDVRAADGRVLANPGRGFGITSAVQPWIAGQIQVPQVMMGVDERLRCI